MELPEHPDAPPDAPPDRPLRWDPPGAEVADPPTFTPPEVRLGATLWQPYYGVRFDRRTRIAITAVLFVPPTLLLLTAGYFMVAASDGRGRAFAVLMLMLLIPVVPVARMFFLDLWRPRH